MYTRVVELTSKYGKARELCKTIEDKVLLILRKQAGEVVEHQSAPKYCCITTGAATHARIVL